MLTSEYLVARLKATNTSGEWDYIVRTMLLDNAGDYPTDWDEKVIESGVASDAEKRWTTIGLGDTVRLLSSVEDGFKAGKVIQVYENGDVDYFRPYIHTEDFSMCGSEPGASKVIAYIGTETVRRVPSKSLKLIRKGDPLK